MTPQTPEDSPPELFARWLGTRIANAQTGYRWEHANPAEREFWRSLDAGQQTARRLAQIEDHLDGAERTIEDYRALTAELQAGRDELAAQLRAARDEDRSLRARVARLTAEVVRDALEALCLRDGLSLESTVTPGEPARNYELAGRLGIGHVFGLKPLEDQ